MSGRTIGDSRARPDTVKPGSDFPRATTLTVFQTHDRLAVLGHPIFIDGDPWVITDIKPQREAGVILGPIVGTGYSVESRIVVVTVEKAK